MDTKIIYEVNENWHELEKDWSVKIIGLYESLTLVMLCDGQGLYALLDGAVYSDKLQKVTLKYTKSIRVFEKFSEAVNAFSVEVSRRCVSSNL